MQVIIICYNTGHLEFLQDFIDSLVNSKNAAYSYKVWLYSVDAPTPELQLKLTGYVTISECDFIYTDTIFLRHICSLYSSFGNQLARQGVISLVRISGDGHLPPAESVFKNILNSAETLFFDLYTTQKKTIIVKDLENTIQKSLNLITQPLKKLTYISSPGPIYAFHAQVFLHRSLQFYNDILANWTPENIQKHLYTILLLDNIKRVYFGVY